MLAHSSYSSEETYKNIKNVQYRSISHDIEEYYVVVVARTHIYQTNEKITKKKEFFLSKAILWNIKLENRFAFEFFTQNYKDFSTIFQILI